MTKRKVHKLTFDWTASTKRGRYPSVWMTHFTPLNWLVIQRAFTGSLFGTIFLSQKEARWLRDRLTEYLKLRKGK
jgi:hypothetical protein